MIQIILHGFDRVQCIDMLKILLLFILSNLVYANFPISENDLVNQITTLSRDVFVSVNTAEATSLRVGNREITNIFEGSNDINLENIEKFWLAKGSKVLDLSAGLIFSDIHSSNSSLDNFIIKNNIRLIVANGASRLTQSNNCLQNSAHFYITNNVRFRKARKRARKYGVVNFANWMKTKTIKTRKHVFKCGYDYPEDLSFSDFMDTSLDDLKKNVSEIQRSFKSFAVDNIFEIRDLIARRFINRKDWESQFGKKEENPKLVYLAKDNPNPYIVWENWQKTEQDILSAVLDRVEQTKEVAAPHLNALNRGSLKDIDTNRDSGNFRVSVGSFYNGSHTGIELKMIENFDFELARIPLDPKREVRLSHTRINQNNSNYKLYSIKVIYVSGAYVKQRVFSLLDTVNKKMKEVMTLDEIINLATKAQREFVAIHPFSDGNGRTSRYFMDLVTSYFDIPPLLIHDHNDDLTSYLSRYKLLAKRGMFHSLKLAEQCLERYQLNINEVKGSKCDVVEAIE